MKFDEVLKK